MTSKISLQSHPEIKVITSTKFRNKNELKSPEQLLHKRRRDSSSSTTSSSSSSTSSSSSESSLSEGDYADSSIQFCDLCSTDRTLLTIVSIPTSRKHGGEYYHVVNNVTEETIDIEKYDRIIRINSNDVKNIDPVEFRDILQTELSSSKCFKFRKRTSM
ncbi:pinin-like, partial [Saccostrea cucullata]|uniref:pinin-like n=1 Tax=Saccostrea cuccullata TaxID=36930 RepID=UPI002ED6288C